MATEAPSKKSTAKEPLGKTRRIQPAADEVFVLFLKNIEKIRAWYGRQPGRGRELGEHTIMEITCGIISLAMDLALQGKEWEPA